MPPRLPPTKDGGHCLVALLLEWEFDYLTSDEAAAEAITATGYTFKKTGRRFG